MVSQIPNFKCMPRCQKIVSYFTIISLSSNFTQYGIHFICKKAKSLDSPIDAFLICSLFKDRVFRYFYMVLINLYLTEPSTEFLFSQCLPQFSISLLKGTETKQIFQSTLHKVLSISMQLLYTLF